MKLINKYLMWGVMVACFLSCQDDAIVENLPNNVFSNLPKTITVSLGEDKPSSRLTYEETTANSLKVLKSNWESDDVVYINPYASVSNKALYAAYKLESGQGTSMGTFVLDTDNSYWPGNYSFDKFHVYYGGTSIKNDTDFLGHSYESQTQNGNGNLSHIEALHTVRTELAFTSSTTFNTAYIDLSEEGVQQSSCIKLELSGFPENITPTKVSIITLDENNFWIDSFGKYNYLSYGEHRVYDNVKDDKLHKLTLSLTGYSSTNRITAYMMMSNRPVYLNQGSKLRVLVESNTKKYIADKEITSNKQLTGGAYHILSINDGWTEYDVTSSTDYSKDGTVETKQTATGVTKGVDLVFMGDGFMDTDINNGDYKKALDQAYEDFFTVEPYKSLKNYFNVYYVTAVSENQSKVTPAYEGNTTTVDPNGAVGTGASTKFATYFTPGATAMGGNNSLVLEYAKKALGTNADERIKTAQVVVVVNASTHAGTNHSYIDESTDYGASWGIAYTPKDNPSDNTGEARRLTLVHEAGGHGVGKLADEYGGNTVYTNPSSVWSNLNDYHQWGYDRNVDKYDATITKANVYWKDLIDTYEESEELGVYSEGGAYTVAKDFCRPSVNSVMRSQFEVGGTSFNAASRWAIWYRIMKLTGADSEPTVGEFFTWDQAHPQVASSSIAIYSRSVNDLLPLAPPVYVKGQWINGRFIEE